MSDFEIVRDKTKGYALFLEKKGVVETFLTQNRATYIKYANSPSADSDIIFYSRCSNVHYCSICGLPTLSSTGLCHDCRKRLQLSGDPDISKYLLYKALSEITAFDNGSLILSSMYHLSLPDVQKEMERLHSAILKKDLDVSEDILNLYLDYLFTFEQKRYKLFDPSKTTRDPLGQIIKDYRQALYIPFKGFIDKPTARNRSRITSLVYSQISPSQEEKFLQFAMEEYVLHGKESGFLWSQLTDKTYNANGLYISHCFICNHTIDSRYNKKCPECGRFFCEHCGHCMCGYTKDDTIDDDSTY